MIELAGDSRMSVEGDLSRCRFAHDLILNRDETAVLKRQTTEPQQDFVILRLTPDTIDPIFTQMMVAGLKRAIIHVQIERNGVIELGAYDNFHPECIVTGPGVSRSLLEDLKAKAIVRSFEIARPKP